MDSSEKKLKRVQQKQYRNLQARLYDSWEKYERKEKTTAQFKCWKRAHILTAPVVGIEELSQ